MTNVEQNEISGELKLILHRLEELNKNQTSGFSELKTRIGAIEEESRRNAVWQGKMQQRIEHIEKDVDQLSDIPQEDIHGTQAMSKLSMLALGALGSALTIIATLVSRGGI